MAKTGAVWGIDLGQTALKALRCRAAPEGDRIVAEAFDFIEYPKMLSQPDANPVELIKEALETFLSRNSLTGDRVAISVSGQSGLARFIKLPPVESKKIPDIVRYEARQQIPFALEDVVWDYQQMAGGSMEEGFALETEVGLFAMKRDQVNRALKPFIEAGIEVDIVQLTPLALYNFITFDQMPDIPPQDQYDPENPPASTVVLSLGTDVSDLVVTNGYKVWQRTINLGGNHFTKALTKQLKLTLAKAEHLKRNAMKAEDPKAVFQAMRPVFGELLGEVQRSLSFFQNLERNAKLGRVVPLGNAMKLRGLHKYLSQNLGLEISEFESYRQLDGPSVTGSPAFKENMLSYPVCYGLAVQALGKGRLNTNLLPREIMKDRMIRAKKPYAVACVAVLLLGCLLGYVGKWREWNSAREDDAFRGAFASAKSAQDLSSSTEDEFKNAKQKFDDMRATGQTLASIGERRVLVGEMLKAVNECLPHDEKKIEDPSARNELHIESVDMEYCPDLKTWWDEVKDLVVEDKPAAAKAETAKAPGADNGGEAPAAPPADAGPDGPGWIIQLSGYHYHNKNKSDFGADYLRRTLIAALKDKNKKIDLIGGQFTLQELGIGYPVIVTKVTSLKTKVIINPNVTDTYAGQAQPTGGFGGFGGAAAGGGAKGAPAGGAGGNVPIDQQAKVTVQEYDFVVQFVWKPTTLSQRLEKPDEQKKGTEQPQVANSDAGGKN